MLWSQIMIKAMLITPMFNIKMSGLLLSINLQFSCPPLLMSIQVEYYANLSNFVEASRQLKNHGDHFVAEDGPVESENHDSVGSASIPTKIISDDNQESASTFDDSFGCKLKAAEYTQK
ncbi:unnamed protein product [Vicia faba]|uniref:Uncharacterized protein n=1 Tax=Vicia faba TaxID=3906 RepID=A0AAV0ZR36_VICFA|nr:unnamed protein product [Vicia faba]